MTKVLYFLPMHQVLFIVYPGFELLDPSGPTSVFNGANRALRQAREPPFYRVDLISAVGGPVPSSSEIVVHTRRLDEFSQQAIGTSLIVGAEREHLMPAGRRLFLWPPHSP
jgi:transcriptional regulator GlxA family with amidase domain